MRAWLLVAPCFFPLSFAAVMRGSAAPKSRSEIAPLDDQEIDWDTVAALQRQVEALQNDKKELLHTILTLMKSNLTEKVRREYESFKLDSAEVVAELTKKLAASVAKAQSEEMELQKVHDEEQSLSATNARLNEESKLMDKEVAKFRLEVDHDKKALRAERRQAVVSFKASEDKALLRFSSMQAQMEKEKAHLALELKNKTDALLAAKSEIEELRHAGLDLLNQTTALRPELVSLQAKVRSLTDDKNQMIATVENSMRESLKIKTELATLRQECKTNADRLTADVVAAAENATKQGLTMKAMLNEAQATIKEQEGKLHAERLLRGDLEAERRASRFDMEKLDQELVELRKQVKSLETDRTEGHKAAAEVAELRASLQKTNDALQLQKSLSETLRNRGSQLLNETRTLKGEIEELRLDSSAKGYVSETATMGDPGGVSNVVAQADAAAAAQVRPAPSSSIVALAAPPAIAVEQSEGSDSNSVDAELTADAQAIAGANGDSLQFMGEIAKLDAGISRAKRSLHA